MKFKLIIDETEEERVIVYAHAKTPLIEDIKALVEEKESELVGYTNEEALCLSTKDIFCFTIIENRLYALTENEKLLIKQRLYQIQDTLGEDFIKINQSTIVNRKKIDRFATSIGGALMVKLKNGYKDYVSRRQLKIVKEKMGIK